MHLEAILKEKLNGAKIDMIIPEFPIQKGSILKDDPFNNQSYKIDYVVYSKSKNLVYFIELKIDMHSRNLKQDDYLQGANEIGLFKILQGLSKIYKASNYRGKSKYNHLIKKLNEINWVNGNDQCFEILENDIKTEIIYIQPIIKENDKNKESIITFKEIIKNLTESEEPLTKRFLESLEKWETDCEKLHFNLWKKQYYQNQHL